jgi:hypothetical protein
MLRRIAASVASRYFSQSHVIPSRFWQGRQAAAPVCRPWSTGGPFDVLEIGAGLGRNAYFPGKFGVKNYTIVDIPSTQLAQGYYLGRVLGTDAVGLPGDPNKKMNLRSAKWLHEAGRKFHLVFNADS